MQIHISYDRTINLSGLNLSEDKLRLLNNGLNFWLLNNQKDSLIYNITDVVACIQNLGNDLKSKIKKN